MRSFNIAVVDNSTRLGEPEGFLVIFDRRKGVPWSQKLALREAATPDLQRAYVFEM